MVIWCYSKLLGLSELVGELVSYKEAHPAGSPDSYLIRTEI